MKSLLVKSFLPVAAFMLASAGAVSTSASSAVQPTVQGFRQTPVGCQFEKMCNNNGNILCHDAIGNQLFGKLTPTSDCTLVLTHRPPNQ